MTKALETLQNAEVIKDKMKKEFIKYIEQHKMLEKGERIVLGVSGGADSVCLLLLLNELKDQYGLELTATHVNHGIRGSEADRDERFVRELCGQLDIKCMVYKENVPEYALQNGLTVEEAGREIRYKRFAEVCEKNNCGKLAVAHNADDRTETILFNIIRGSSLAGLCGMQPVSRKKFRIDSFEAEFAKEILQEDDFEVEISIIRPLLDTSRREIEEYLNSINAKWCEDSTNAEEDYSRNYIRHTLIPAMEKLRKGASEHIKMLSSEALETKRFIDNEADKYYKMACEGNRLSVKVCVALPEVIKKELVYRFITENTGHKKDIHRVHVLNILELLQNKVGKSVDLPYDITVKREYEYLAAFKRSEYTRENSLIQQTAGRNFDFAPVNIDFESDEDFIYPLENGKQLRARTFRLDKNAEIPREKLKVWFDADKIGQKLVLRVPCEGDYFCPYTDGRRKKLTRLFIEDKLPKEERSKTLIVAMEQRCIWAIGLRRDEALRVDESTKSVLELSVEDI